MSWHDNFDADCFVVDMSNAPWHLVGPHSSSDDALATWEKRYKSVVNGQTASCTTRTKQLSPVKWLNNEVKTAMYTRDQFKKN